MRTLIGLLLLTVAVAAGCISAPKTAELSRVEAPIGGGLRVTFDHPCPEGGPLDIQVEESDTTVVITGYLTGGGGIVLDCVGDWTWTELERPLAERRVIDGSTGEVVEVLRP